MICLGFATFFSVVWQTSIEQNFAQFAHQYHFGWQKKCLKKFKEKYADASYSVYHAILIEGLAYINWNPRKKQKMWHS